MPFIVLHISQCRLKFIVDRIKSSSYISFAALVCGYFYLLVEQKTSGEIIIG